jgi:ferritin-like metal-binding protein YciE
MKKDMQNLFIEELEDMMSSEKQIIEALPEMVKAAESPDLKEAFKTHLEETKGQLQRLKQIFKILNKTPSEEVCQAMKGLIKEGQETIKNFERSAVRDAALISKAQRIEHYEIAAYGTLRTFAKELELDDAVDLLDETLDEESSADKKLTQLAEGGILTAGINQRSLNK